MATTTVLRRRVVPATVTKQQTAPAVRTAVRTRRQAEAATRRETSRTARAPRQSRVTENIKERTAIQEGLAQYAELQAQIDALQTQLDTKRAEIQKTYDEHGMTEEITGHGFKVLLKPKKGRSSTKVDTKALLAYFKKQKNEAGFWEIATANISDIKKFVPEKDLSQVAETIPGKDGHPEFVIERAK